MQRNSQFFFKFFIPTMTSFDLPYVCPGCSYKLKYLRLFVSSYYFFMALPPANATQLTPTNLLLSSDREIP
jgi:hypothetical protein